MYVFSDLIQMLIPIDVEQFTMDAQPLSYSNDESYFNEEESDFDSFTFVAEMPSQDALYSMMNFQTDADLFAVPIQIADIVWSEWTQGAGFSSDLIPVSCPQSDASVISRREQEVSVHLCPAKQMNIKLLDPYVDYEIFVRSRAGVTLFYTRPNIVIPSFLIRRKLNGVQGRRRSSKFDFPKLFDGVESDGYDSTTPNTDEDEELGSVIQGRHIISNE